MTLKGSVGLKSIQFSETEFYELHEGRWHRLLVNGERDPAVRLLVAGGMQAFAHSEGTRICVTTRIHTKIVKKKKGAGSKFPDDPHGILEPKT